MLIYKWVYYCVSPHCECINVRIPASEHFNRTFKDFSVYYVEHIGARQHSVDLQTTWDRWEQTKDLMLHCLIPEIMLHDDATYIIQKISKRGMSMRQPNLSLFSVINRICISFVVSLFKQSPVYSLPLWINLLLACRCISGVNFSLQIIFFQLFPFATCKCRPYIYEVNSCTSTYILQLSVITVKYLTYAYL